LNQILIIQTERIACTKSQSSDNRPAVAKPKKITDHLPENTLSVL